MATITNTTDQTADQKAAAKASQENAVATNKATNAAHDKAHEDISARNAKHEAFVNARKELADNHERDVLPYGDVDGNKDTRGKRGERDGNVADADKPAVNVEPHRSDREWLQHEDFEGGAARAQELRDQADRDERKNDREEIAAEREAAATGTAGHSGLPADKATDKPAPSGQSTATTASVFGKPAA